ncbi:MAG TPA: hypothetical protein VF746_13990 [Longimicrobium sp.]
MPTSRSLLRAAIPAALALLAALPARAAAQRTASPQTQAALDSARARLESLRAAVAALDSLLRPVPGLDSRQGPRDARHMRWLADVRRRLGEHAAALAALVEPPAGRAPDTAPDPRETARRVAELSREFLALQEAIQQESRRFQTLSDASRARHENAMIAVRNARG